MTEPTFTTLAKPARSADVVLELTEPLGLVKGNTLLLGGTELVRVVYLDQDGRRLVVHRAEKGDARAHPLLSSVERSAVPKTCACGCGAEIPLAYAPGHDSQHLARLLTWAQGEGYNDFRRHLVKCFGSTAEAIRVLSGGAL